MGSIQPAVETRQLASDPKCLMTYSSKLPLATRIFFHVDLFNAQERYYQDSVCFTYSKVTLLGKSCVGLRCFPSCLGKSLMSKKSHGERV